MCRKRLALLALCALLTTGLQPFGDDGDTARSAALSTGVAIAHAIETIPEPSPVDDLSRSLSIEDRRIAAEFAKRLAQRHTGLPPKERLRVAHAIVIEARRQQLEPDLVIAVIQVESAGYTLAVSHVGAMGLMQLLPSTGEEVAHKMGIEWMGDDTLFDPIINVKLGTAYLRQLADRYDDVTVALAAYNWGPGRIDRRIRRGQTIPSKYIEQVNRAHERYGSSISRRS